MWTSRWDTVRGAAGWVEPPEVDGAVGPPVRYADVSIPPALMAAQSLRLDEVDRSVTGFVPGESVELVSQRRPDSSVFANPDGTKTLRVFDGVAFVPDEGMRELAAAGLALETGELLAPVDTTLVRRGDGRVAPVRAETVSFGADARDAALARVHTGAGAWMGFGLADAPRVEPVLDGSTVTYPSVADGADIRFTVTAAGSEPYRMLPVVGPARSPRPPSNQPVHAGGPRDGQRSITDVRRIMESMRTHGWTDHPNNTTNVARMPDGILTSVDNTRLFAAKTLYEFVRSRE
jgi:hypothetical protein